MSRPRRRGNPPALFAVPIAVVAGCATSGNVFSLQAGDCFDDPGTAVEQVANLTEIDCDEPHDSEVYAVIELADRDYPGRRTTLERAQDDCIDAFEPFVGQSYERSPLFASWLVPTEGSWAEGDREVVCFLFDADGPLEASMEGSSR